ncbi:MAG: DMT family transporter, partial [Alphaproteobacteria bacterium]
MTIINRTAKIPLSRPQQGLLLALLCYVLWCAGDAGVKTVAMDGVGPFETIALFSWISAALLVGLAAVRGNLESLKPVDMRMTLIRGATIAFAQVCIVIAFAHLSLALFYTIVFLSPFLVALGARIFLRESLPWGVGLAILAGFTGVVIAVDPVQIISGKGDLVGIIAATACAVGFSVGQLMLRRMSHTETSESLVFSVMIIAGVITSIPAFNAFASISWKTVVVLTLTATFATIANLAMAQAMRFTTAANVASLQDSQIIPGAIFGYILWSDIPTWNVWAGSAVIIAAGLVM